ncbi:MAG: hypothetical protein IJH38_04190 [Clostridia bacterium]|nr:hypothetical protein [Clostridia bacterium]
MKSYFVEGCDSKELYQKLIRYMIAYSDSFSLTYFRHNRIERLKRTAKRIKEKLEPYKLYAKETTHLPSMETLNYNSHIYELTVYRASAEVVSVLEELDSLWQWDYPCYPMDLCFFKSGLAWFMSSAHEEYAILYTDDPGVINDLRDLGLKFSGVREAGEDELYRDTQKS